MDRILEQHVNRILKNRAKARDTILLAETLFDLARDLRSSSLETIAIEVDGWAQEGHNVTREETEAVIARVMEAGS